MKIAIISDVHGNLEALKAQAIASRTYLINHLQTNNSISNTTDDQVYLTEKEMKLKWGDDYEKQEAGDEN